MKVPKYRIRRDRDQAYVEMDGRRIPLPGRARELRGTPTPAKSKRKVGRSR